MNDSYEVQELKLTLTETLRRDNRTLRREIFELKAERLALVIMLIITIIFIL